MRAFTALLGLLACVPGRAQEGRAAAAPAQAQVPEPVAPTMAAMPGESGVFLLRQGGTLAGRLISTGPDGDVVELADQSVVRLRAGSVVGVVAGTGEAAASSRIEVERRDGRVLSGRLISRDATSVTVDVDGSPTPTPLSEIRAVRLAPGTGIGPSWLDVPSASAARIRTMQAPTAFRLEPWEAAVSVTGLAEPTVTLGVTRYGTVSVSVAFPGLYGQTGSESWRVSGDAGFEPLRLIHVSAGFRAEFQSGTQGWFHGALTGGTPGAYLSLYAGPPPLGAVDRGEFGKVALSLAGGAELLPSVWVLAESWFGRGTEGQVSTQYGGGVRVGWSFFFFEVGLVSRPSGEFPVWASFGAGGRPAGGQRP